MYLLKLILTQECSKISSLMCMEADGSTLVAAGYENGKLGLWGGIQIRYKLATISAYVYVHVHTPLLMHRKIWKET